MNEPAKYNKADMLMKESKSEEQGEHDDPIFMKSGSKLMKRRNFIKTFVTSAAVMSFPGFVIKYVGKRIRPSAAKPTGDNNPILPWQREIPLREAAKSVTLESVLNPTDPNNRSTMNINNLKMHTVLWGPPDRITISINKNNVWDRRLHEFHAPTLEEMTEGAFSPANKDYVGVKEIDSLTFAIVDILHLAPLARKLAKKSDAVSAYLYSRLNDKTKSSLNAYQTATTNAYEAGCFLLTNLVANFNAIIDGPSLYDDKPFQNVQLRPETEALLKKNPHGEDLRHLNRLLMEDAYPTEISRKPGNSLRPLDLGWLAKEGGSIDPYRYPMRYAFPSLKPVGQIILGIDPLAGAPAPHVVQSCANSVTSLQIASGNAEVNIEYALGMTDDVYAIRANISGIKMPVWLRLYRHQDTSHLVYMTPDGKYKSAAAEADKAFNGPIDPPTSGTDGRYFWIRQKMPAEKTFPQGFEYVLMAVVTTPGKVELVSEEGKTCLGTPPADSPMPWDWFGVPRPSIADAPGAAATATFVPGSAGKLEALVTIVTTMDGQDLIALAKKRLAETEAEGFDGVVRKNTNWWNAFYDKRENGRVFYGLTGIACTDNIHNIHQSYTDSHGGGTKTDMRQLECSASYARPERDIQDFDSAPCYNEIFCTSRFVRNWGDSEDMWKQIVEYWTPGGQENARDRFNMPGMLITHGYLPPVKPDKYVHTAIALELCLGTMAEIIRPAWDEWDYGGDINVLRQECYPMLKQMALFYAAYTKKGADGYYHIIPCMEEERWGIYPKFSHNKDVISSLCMFRWGLTRAADAAELLHVDAGLCTHWRKVAAKIAPYPTWQEPNGRIYGELPGFEPRRDPRDHQNEVSSYLTTLADEINLDSSQSQKEMMLRTVRRTPQAASTGEALTLLGVAADPNGKWHGGGGGGGGAGIGGDAETFLNSRSGRIHLFPAIWPSTVVAFRNFQARGGFLVSAAKDADGVYYLEICARRSISCQVMNPWPGKKVVVLEEGTKAIPVKIDSSNGECIEFSAAVGHKYLINPKIKISN
jgi:Glycosyl hydrolase family 95 catalytic domain